MRSVILERKKEAHLAQLDLEEVKLRHLCSSIYGAAGSKDGVKAANRIELYERERRIVVPSTAEVMRLFGG